MSTYQLHVLVTLVLTVAFLVPESGNAESYEFQYAEKRSTRSTLHKYCGKKLANALQLVCSGVYNPMFKKNGQEMEMDDSFAYDESYPFSPRVRAIGMMGQLTGPRFRREPRGVYDECCAKACSTYELSSYCGLK